jgi:hypothetical protein
MAKAKKPIELDDAGDPEPTAKEAELILEQLDADEKNAPLSEQPPEVREQLSAEITKAVGALHQLDLEPINSKIVVTQAPADKPGGAFLATPTGARRLPDNDPAHKLPVGARIRKLAEEKYVGEQLSPSDPREQLICTTAAECIARFVEHFHGKIKTDE